MNILIPKNCLVVNGIIGMFAQLHLLLLQVRGIRLIALPLWRISTDFDANQKPLWPPRPLKSLVMVNERLTPPPGSTPRRRGRSARPRPVLSLDGRGVKPLEQGRAITSAGVVQW